MLTNCLAAYAHLTIAVSEIQRDIGRKSSIFYTALAFDAPVRGFPLEQRHPVWCGKTRMAWLPHGEKNSKISLFVLAQLTNVTDGRTDGQTPHAGNSRTIYAQHRTAKTIAICSSQVIISNDTHFCNNDVDVSVDHIQFHNNLASVGKLLSQYVKLTQNSC